MRQNYMSSESKEIKAKWNCECAETGKIIKKGDFCLYFPNDRNVYHVSSKTYYGYRCAKMDETL